MNNLPREKQIEVIAALCDGLGVRAAARITGVNRGTVAALALKLGHGCAEAHDRHTTNYTDYDRPAAPEAVSGN